jgi:hypothetical protein
MARQTLTRAERVLGKEHPQTLIGAQMLALIYDAQGLYGEAEPLSPFPGGRRARSAESIRTPSPFSAIWENC